MKFTVRCEYYDTERQIEAYSPSVAAEEFARVFDWESAEYPIVSGECIEVVVRQPNGCESKWAVSGESVPEYYASKIEV